MKKLRDLLVESFSPRELENILKVYKGKVTPNAHGIVQRYIQTLEKALEKSGETSRVTSSELKSDFATHMAQPGGPGGDDAALGMFQQTGPSAEPTEPTAGSTAGFPAGEPSKPMPSLKQVSRSTAGQKAAQDYLGGKQKGLEFDPTVMKRAKQGKDTKIGDTEYMQNIKKGLSGKKGSKLGQFARDLGSDIKRKFTGGDMEFPDIKDK